MFGSPWTALPLKMGPIGCPETSVTTNLRRVNIPKERISHLHSRARMFRCNWPELAEENLYIRDRTRCPGQDSNRAPMKSERYCFQHLVPYKVNYFNLVFFLTNESPY